MSLQCLEVLNVLLDVIRKYGEILRFATSADDGVLTVATEDYFIQLGIGDIGEISDDLAEEIQENVLDMHITRAIQNKLEKENTGWILLMFEQITK